MSVSKHTMITTLAKAWGCPTCRVKALIKAGELLAFNGATDLDGRPQLFVSNDSIHAFETRRRVMPELPNTRKLRTKSTGDVRKFF